MLSKILSKEKCAGCRFCCSFRRISLWELPGFPPEFAAEKTKGTDGKSVKYLIKENKGMKYAITDLTGSYLTEDMDEEVKCPFLDENTGCTLPEDEKPFDCKIWPLRYMELESGEKKIALAPSCPEINRLPVEEIKRLVREGLGEAIINYAGEHPYIIKKYKEGYIIL